LTPDHEAIPGEGFSMTLLNIPLILLTYTAGLSVVFMIIHNILRGGPQSVIHRTYYLACCLDLTWCVSYFVMYITCDERTATIAYRAGALGWTVNIAVLFILSVRIIETILEKKWPVAIERAIIFSSVIFFAAALNGDVFATGFTRMPGGWWAERPAWDNPWALAYAVWSAGILFFCVATLLSMTRITRLRRHRHYLIFIFSPLIVIIFFTVLINLLLPLSGNNSPPIGHILVSFYLAFIGYGIFRFRVITPDPEIIAAPLLFQISDMVILTDNKGKILRTNQAVSDLLDYRTDELTSRHVRMILPGVFLTQVEAVERNAVTSRGKTLPVNCTINQVNDLHGDCIGFFILLKDLTRIRKMEELMKILQASNMELDRLAVTDSLTELFNRNKVVATIEQEILRSKRYKSTFSVILFDIDHFKSINDTYGHMAGDEVLRLIADSVRNCIRETDIAGRWGGEEFIILCINTDHEAAAAMAEKIRYNFEKLEPQTAGRVTASFGVTEYLESDTMESILLRCDEAMYLSKHLGRNQTSVKLS
jgi:diguanylate cyclase (GGDEF)-like protein/PAS domain S-box-containing protein